MKSERYKAFWMSFFLTLLVMTPGLMTAMAAVRWQPQGVARSQSGIPIRLPDERHQITVLAVVAGETPAFVLVGLDAVEGLLQVVTLPGESLVRTASDSQTLAACYAAAGPARAARLLSETLALPIDRYLAATPESWASMLADAGPVRVGLSGALTAGQRQAAGLADGMESWTVSAAHTFLTHLAGLPQTVLPQDTASARAVLWQGWARQNLDKLPRLLPAGLREESGRLLTNLTATDLLTLEETLEFLADAQVQPAAQAMPGSWDAAAGHYLFNEETLAFVQASFNSDASTGASDSASVP